MRWLIVWIAKSKIGSFGIIFGSLIYDDWLMIEVSIEVNLHLPVFSVLLLLFFLKESLETCQAWHFAGNEMA